ncbi:MAG: glutathionylspermidine synthase family protein [Pontiellaceae bacterium]|nr:glutathionylspermidine synthase family protein [Pontiellaceae bacterium]
MPLIWKKSGCKLPAWQSLLPETAHPARFFQSSDWILKPALGRVGEGIALPGDATKTERFKIALSAVLDPRDWVAQRKFESLPIASATDKRHICIGAFAVGEKFCGFYGRVNTAPKIDGRAQDIPVLVETPD